MNPQGLEDLLRSVKDGRVPLSQAIDIINSMSFHDLGFAKVDTARPRRTGQPEAVFCDRKSSPQIAEIADTINTFGADALLTRLEREKATELAQTLGDKFVYYADPRVGVSFCGAHHTPHLRGRGSVAVVTAGSADIPVAEEAALTAWVMGCEIERVWDVGVAGIHRLHVALPTIRKADVVIVVAGMEGALTSVVAGLVNKPVIGVPTSVGYGASFGGVAALLAMLNSCAAAVTVVNIDNGFGAGSAAARIASLTCAESTENALPNDLSSSTASSGEKHYSHETMP